MPEPDAPTTTASDDDTGASLTNSDSSADGPSREAARRRVQLREVEAERDALRDRLAAAQRREAVRLIGDRLAQPGDLFDIGGTALDDLLDDDGAVSAERLDAAVDDLLAARPGLAAPKPPVWPDLANGPRGEAPTAPPATWASTLGALRDGRRDAVAKP